MRPEIVSTCQVQEQRLVARHRTKDRWRHDAGRQQAVQALLQRRWMLRVLWELRTGASTFRALQQACGDLSPTVLNQRLSELREAGMVVNDDTGYHLTPMGQELLEAFAPLSRWAVRWHKGRA